MISRTALAANFFRSLSGNSELMSILLAFDITFPPRKKTYL